jgi:two-component sensor histidine kinase
VFRQEGDKWIEVARESGLTGSFMRTIVEDENGQAWAGVTAGVARVGASPGRGNAQSIRIIDESDGFAGTISGKPNGWPPAARSADGRLWFATSHGLGVIDPLLLHGRTTTRVPRIDRVVADEREFWNLPEIEVAPGTAMLQIDYGALDLSMPQSIRFRYLLEGSDTGWVDAGTSRQAFYTNLAPGAYVFRVDITDQDGNWTNRPSQIKLNVLPTFTQTSWFYLLMGGLGLCVIGGAWWLRLRVVRGRFILAERARVAREIHDTLLQSLGSVALELEAVTNQLGGEPQATVETLRQLRRHVTDCVREARDSIEGLRSTGEPRDLVKSLNEFVRSSSAGKDVSFTVSVVGNGHRPTSSEVVEQLLRISQEAVTNSLRHGHPKAIQIDLEYQNDAVLLSVTDDGCGFDAKDPLYAAPGHWGIAIMRERAAIVGGSFHITSDAGKGTAVEVVLPLQADADAR